MAQEISTTPVEKLWTPANIVTLLRICGVPVFVIAIISPWPSWLPEWMDALYWKEWVAAGIFILLAASDGLDGYLARSRGEVTNFGKFMDPLADKILVAAALLALIELHVLPSWVALIILCREFIVSGIRMVAASQGVVIAASWYGKAKTVSQIIAIVLFIIKDSHALHDFSDVLADKLYLISWAVMIIALVLTIISMLDYFVKARHILGFESATSKAKRNTEATVKPTLDELTEGILASSRHKSLTLGTAESCTGGLIAAALTSIPGSSDVVAGAVVSYSNEVKQSSLKVSQETLNQYGAVSEQTAIQMAQGARESLGVDIAVSVTGIAGPDGGSSQKPIGTVWIGLADKQGGSASVYHFDGNRESVREQAVYEALQALQQKIG